MKTVLIEASPMLADGSANAAIRLAGLGSRAYTHKGFNDWRSGVTNLPRITTAIGFDDTGWTGGATPQTTAIRYFGSDKTFLSYLGGLYWKDAPITVSIGDDAAASPTWATNIVGTVADHKTDGGAVTITVADLSGVLGKSPAPDSFAGTGDLEGDASAAGRMKRRSLGYVFNVEGFVLDAANNVYEFGDPNRPLQDFPLVKDKGLSAGSLITVAWQGSALATLNALRSSSPPAGGAAIAPSIACVKWWTQPAGPLTADIKGETAGGYSEVAAQIGQRLLSAYPTIMPANLSDAASWRPFSCGIHIDESSETAANILDRLFLPISLLWIIDAAGNFILRQWAWGASVETLRSDTISRQTIFPPLATRKLGYQKNHRVQNDGEISAGITASADGLNSATVYLYQRAGSTPPLPTSEVTYTFSTGSVTGANNGWVNPIPSGTGTIYVTQAVASSTGDTDTIEGGEWSSAVILAQAGNPGTNGANGTDGDDGTPAYVHTAYADSPDGSSNFSFDPGVRTYLGVYTDANPAASGDYHAYAWSKIKGDKGDPGLSPTPALPPMAVDLGTRTYPTPVSLEAGQTIHLNAVIAAAAVTGTSVNVTIQIQMGFSGSGSWGVVASTTDSYQTGDQIFSSTGVDFTNNSGATRAYDVRVVVSTSGSGSPGAVDHSQSILTLGL